jgi:hypothetical protein
MSALFLRFVVLVGLIGACRSISPAPLIEPERPNHSGSGDSTATCVVDDDTLRTVYITVDQVSGDSLFHGKPISEAFPTASPPYAASAAWYVANAPITLDNRYYYKQYPPRYISSAELIRLGHFQGVPVFGMRRSASPESAVAVPLRPGCIFQIYIP